MMELLSVFFRNSLFASVMILAVLAVRPLLRKAPRNICCLLWLLVALRLLLPFQLESPLSLQPDVFEEPAQITLIVETEPPAADVLPMDPPVIDVPQQLPTEVPADTAPQFQWETALPILWICGALSMLIYSAVSYGVLKHRVGDAVKTSDGAWESDRIEGAFLLGYCRPRIYIPVGLQQHDRAFILSHERSHQSRGDHWWKLLGMLCLSIHWYNPLVWLSYALLCRDIETACDERVIRTMELEQRRAYSFALLNSGKRMSGFLAYPVAFGEISLKQRIKDVLSYRKPGIWVTLIAVILAAVIVVCFMTTPDSPEPVSVQKPPVTDEQPETTTLPTTEPTQPTTPPTEPATEPTTEPTPPATEPTEVTTVATEPATTPTEPTPTEPVPTKPEPTQPKPTEPPVTKPQGPRVIAEGKWGAWTPWKITSDGVLTLSGVRYIEGTSSMWYSWMDYKDQVTKIVITDGITKIPDHAFYGMHKVTEVSIPDSVEEIGSGAFWDCFSLRTVTIPPKVKELGHSAFLFCTSLRSVKFAAGCSLETISAGAFSDTALEEFHAPASLKFVDENAFYGCNSLKILDLWNCNANIHKSAFSHCPEIRQVLLGKNAYLSQYVYPQWYQVETAKLHSDFYELFSKRPRLKSVEIGGSVREIPSRAFKECTALTDVTITAPITEVGQQAFYQCSSLTKLTLPDTVTQIDGSALAGTGIKSFTVPASVTKIRWGAFHDSALEEIIFLGDAPQFIDETAFRGVTATAYYPADNPTWTPDKLQHYEGHLTWVPVT